jgi:hypothetical protein
MQTFEEVGIAIVNSLFKWKLNGTSMFVARGEPALQQVLCGVMAYDTDGAVITLLEANVMFCVVIDTALRVPNPLHIHGPDFSGTGSYSNQVAVHTANPPQRDTKMLSAAGYLVFAF